MRVAQCQQKKAGEARGEEKGEEGDVKAILPPIRDGRIAAPLQPVEAGGADQQAGAAQRAEQDRQAEVGIRSEARQRVMVEGRYRGRGEAQEKAVERAMVEPA